MRRFVALDGEGYDTRYALLASLYGSIEGPAGLSSLSCIKFLHDLAKTNRDAIFVGFGIGYDVNMMLKDLPDSALLELLDEDKCQTRYEGYILRYYPKKIFEVSKGGCKFVWYDVFSFFGLSFVAALAKFLPHWPTLEAIARGKLARSTFQASELPEIKRYNAMELEALEALVEHLDALFQSQGIYLSRFHGPGALASWLISDEGFDITEDFPRYRGSHAPQALVEAWNCAFFGGRIENVLTGTVQDVRSYDINSAYPYSTSLLPRHLPARFWKNVRTKKLLTDTLSLYLVEWDIGKSRIGPFPFRDSHGLISFPLAGKGWYYAPEVEEAIAQHGSNIRISEAWTQERNELSKLSHVIPSLYAKRNALRLEGNPAEYVLKIALSSMYGKFAQRKGKPMYRCPAWAGFITSKTRAMLLASSRETEVLAFATDSLFTRDRPNLPLSNLLGDWKAEDYSSFTCIQNGFYRLGDTFHSKSANRGIPSRLENAKGELVPLDWTELIRQLETEGRAKFVDRVFVTHKMALANPKAYGPFRLQFINRDGKEGRPKGKTIQPFATTKRKSDVEALESWTKNYTLSSPPRYASEPMSRPIE